MIKKGLLLFFLLFSYVVKAQYTEVINSNRPGYSESPYSVGLGVYQLESSLFFRNTQATPTFSNPQTIGLNLFFRTSFLDEKLELNLNGYVVNNELAFKNIFTSSYRQTDFTATLGAKYLLFTPTYLDKSKEIRSMKKRHAFDWNRWIPHVAVYVGGNFNNAIPQYYDRYGISPKVGLLLQNEFSKRYNFITNIYYDYITTNNPEFSYILTATYNFNDQWSGFAEHQAKFSKFENESNAGIGLAYLFNKNLQINTAARATFNEGAIGYNIALGASYRLDYHKDKFVALDKYGNKIEDEKPKKYTDSKGFFGRLFDKIKNIFKKKKKKKTSTGEEVEEPNRKKKKRSILDDLIKKDEKLKRKKKRADEKLARKAQRAKEKEERKKAKEEKKKQEELNKIYKEDQKIRAEEERLKNLEKQENELSKEEKELEKLEQELKKEKAIDPKEIERQKRKKAKEEKRKKEKEERERLRNLSPEEKRRIKEDKEFQKQLEKEQRALKKEEEKRKKELEKEKKKLEKDLKELEEDN